MIIPILALLTFIQCYTDPTTCISSSKFYDILQLQCVDCPITTPAMTQSSKDFTYCNCSTSHYDNPAVIGFNDSASCFPAPSPYNSTSQVISIYGLDGSSDLTKIPCVDSYPDSTFTQCIPCGNLMTWDSTNKYCKCKANNSYALNGACYSDKASPPNTFILTVLADYLTEQHAVIGCGQYGLVQSCNQLINRCVNSGYSSSDKFCQILTNYKLATPTISALSTYTFSAQLTDSINIFASSIKGTSTSTVKNTLALYLAEYNFDGSLNDFKPLDNSIFRCYMNGDDIVKFMSFGLNFYKSCQTPLTFKTQYYYDVYVQAGDGTYSQVPISISGVLYKRFKPNSPSFNSISISYTTQPPLQVPLITLSTNSPATIMNVSTSTDTNINYLPFFIIFGVIMVVFLIINFYRYLKYNPDENNDPYYCFKAIFLLIIYLFKYIAVTIWLWIFCFSAYCFCFYKFQKTVYLILPDPNSSTTLTKSFEAFFYINFSFMLASLFILIFNMTNETDFFLIDWEKEKQLGKHDMGKNKKQVSIWRKVLLVNELYELSISRIINIEMVSLFSLLFLSGTNWINLNYMVPNTSDLVTDNIQLKHTILSYFIITFVIFTIAIVQYLIRIAFKTWYPLDIQNFIDLCSVSNISIIIFDQSLHGYYIHGMNPLGQSEGSLAQIQSMFQKEAKAFGKSRSFKLEDSDQCQTFQVIFPIEIRQAFQVKYKAKYLQKLAGRAYQTSFLSNPVPEMLDETDYNDLEQINTTMLESFKYYLQGVKTSMLNIRQRSFLQKIINCPIDTEIMGKLPVFFKDQWNEFTNVFLTGHEFLLLFNFINFVNVFYLATFNIYYAFFIAFIFQKLFTFTEGFFIKRNISKNTLIDDKFFN